MFVLIKTMKVLSSKNILILALSLIVSAQVFGQEQTPEPKKINFGYSRNPSSKVKKQPANSAPNISEEKVQISANTNIQSDENFESRSAAKKTLEIAKRSSAAALPPTEIYRVGVNDVLFISLQNAPAKSSTYFTVLSDGAIDYPLAGGMVSVGGLSIEEIEEFLTSKISLYENPQVSVKVREYASHPITVLGAVENSGEKFIQREAVPLFVIKAEAVIKSDADEVSIRRAASAVETFNLNDPKTDEVLILTGDIVEFKNTAASRKSGGAADFFFIGGNVVSGGQKEFHEGLTLTQAILASGGLKKSNAKSVTIRRKNEEGLLKPQAFNLKEIKNGKIPDPEIRPGDTIEIDE